MGALLFAGSPDVVVCIVVVVVVVRKDSHMA